MAVEVRENRSEAGRQTDTYLPYVVASVSNLLHKAHGCKAFDEEIVLTVIGWIFLLSLSE